MPLSRNCKIVSLRWRCFLFCGASASTPILGNFAVYHIGIYAYKKNIFWSLFTLEKLCGFTLEPPITSVLCSNIQCVSELCPNGFPYFPDASDLCSASRWCKMIFGSCFRKFCWVHKHSVCYLPRLSKSILLVFRGTQPVLELSEQLAVHRPGPDDVSESQ